MVAVDSPDSETIPRRVIKRYSNRKLYDTKDSRYVTLLQIAEMVRAHEEVQIIDNATKEDKTDVTLALIISEELKARPRGIPLATLKALIRHRSERFLVHLREGPIGKLIPREQLEGLEEGGPPTFEEDELAGNDAHQKGLKATLEQWHHTIDERIRAMVPDPGLIRDLQTEVKRLSERIDALEKRIDKAENRE